MTANDNYVVQTLRLESTVVAQDAAVAAVDPEQTIPTR